MNLPFNLPNKKPARLACGAAAAGVTFLGLYGPPACSAAIIGRSAVNQGNCANCTVYHSANNKISSSTFR